MRHTSAATFGTAATVAAAVTLWTLWTFCTGALYAQAIAPTNDLPNPYRTVDNHFRMPAGREWGATSGVEIAKDGKSIWVAERCGKSASTPDTPARALNSCRDSKLDPVLLFDERGRLVRSFGAGRMIFPHGMHVDRDGNVWVTDGNDNASAPQAPGSPVATAPNPAATVGHQVFKFGPNGMLLMTIGRAGGATGATACCWQPNDVVTNAAGEIFVAEGHGQNTNDRILKFSKDGTLIKTWGRHGSGPDEFNQPHGLALDSKGRLYVADRGNDRIVITDQDGGFIAEWRQFSRPSGIYIDKQDIVYVADSESGSVNPAHGAWKRGIRIGSASDGKVVSFIPDPNPTTTDRGTLAAEGVAVDAAGNVYGAEVGPARLQQYVKK